MKIPAFTVALCVPALFALISCAAKKSGGENIAVFIPGQMDGSAIYSQLGEGAFRAVKDWNESHGGVPAQVVVVEAGYNQSEWEGKLTMLAAGGQYTLIISSNPSMPYFVSVISKKFPAQKFLLMDSELSGNPNVYTLRYNQREQAYMAGYLAGLLSAGHTRSIGLIAAQEYPVMNTIIKPAYLEGANAALDGGGGGVDNSGFSGNGFSLDYRVVGNWFDAQKAAELGAGMIRDGVRVILPVAGGASEGAVQAAVEGGAKIIWFDSNGYAVRPGTVAGSCAIMQEAAVYDKLTLYFEGKLPFGSAETAGVREGYVAFIDDDPLYIETIPEIVREKQAAMAAKIKSGELTLR